MRVYLNILEFHYQRGWPLNTGKNNSKSQKWDWQTVAAAA